MILRYDRSPFYYRFNELNTWSCVLTQPSPKSAPHFSSYLKKYFFLLLFFSNFSFIVVWCNFNYKCIPLVAMSFPYAWYVVAIGICTKAANEWFCKNNADKSTFCNLRMRAIGQNVENIYLINRSNYRAFDLIGACNWIRWSISVVFQFLCKHIYKHVNQIDKYAANVIIKFEQFYINLS